MSQNIQKDFIVRNSQSKSYEITVKNIRDFLSEENKILRIPKYQRPYSWEEKEVEDLINDIKKSAANNENWFIGTIFSTLDEDLPKYKEILDGQQRITTIVLILRCITTLDLRYSDDFLKLNFLKSDIENFSDFEQQKDFFLQEFSNRKKFILEKLLTKEETDQNYNKIIISKFLTDEGTKEIFEKFIVSTANCLTSEDYEKNKSLSFNLNHNLTPTFERINKNINIIERELGKILREKNEIQIIRFIDTLLNNLIFIEVPLYSSKNILDIFESLNNRGKSLSLSDLIRFITLKSSFDKPDLYEKIEKDWYEIYEVVEKIIKKYGFFKDLDEFLERFINSISTTTNGYTTNHSRINRFKDKYGNDFSAGTNDIKKVLKNLDFLFSWEDGFHANLTSPKKSRVRPLLLIINKILKVSENSQVFFYQYLRSKFQQGEVEVYHLTEFLKTSFYIEILNNFNSNQTRPKFIFLAKHFDSNSTFSPSKLLGTKITSQKIKNNEENDELEESKILLDIKKFSNVDKTQIKNILFQQSSSKEKSKIILYCYQLLTDLDSFPDIFNEKDVHLEHIIPQKWFSNSGWKNQQGSVDQKILIANLDCCNSTILDAITELIKEEDFLSSTSYSKSFVQLIGNKIQIYSKTNIDLTNNYWNEHEDNTKNGDKKTYLKNSFFKDPNNSTLIPTKPKLVFEYDEFNINTAIDISFQICMEFIDKFDDYVLNISN